VSIKQTYTPQTVV